MNRVRWACVVYGVFGTSMLLESGGPVWYMGYLEHQCLHYRVRWACVVYGVFGTSMLTL